MNLRHRIFSRGPKTQEGGAHGLTPLAHSARFIGRNPPEGILLRQGYGGYPPRIHPQIYTRGFLRRRVKFYTKTDNSLLEQKKILTNSMTFGKLHLQ